MFSVNIIDYSFISDFSFIIDFNGIKNDLMATGLSLMAT